MESSKKIHGHAFWVLKFYLAIKQKPENIKTQMESRKMKADNLEFGEKNTWIL